MAGDKRHPIHTFDIDNYLNHIILRPRFYILPRPISHWFGYRPPPKDGEQKQAPPVSVLLVWLFAFLGGFIGISIIENVFRNLPLLGGHQAPLVIASFGAAAILEYNAIESPLSQPRNLIFGHFISAVIGVGITKLFHLLPEARFEELRWLPGALAVGLASAVMGATKTVHPPAGATALLAASTPEISELGWWVLPLVLLAASLMLASAMLVNNLYKRFPGYWWTPVDLGQMHGKENVVKAHDAEKGDARSDSSSGSSSGSTLKPDQQGHHEGGNMPARNIHTDPEHKVQVEIDRLVIPDWMELSEWEVEVLEGFQTKLRSRGPERQT